MIVDTSAIIAILKAEDDAAVYARPSRPPRRDDYPRLATSNAGSSSTLSGIRSSAEA